MEDELLSHQHEEQWLRDKGSQLAQRDAELAGEVLREIGLLETTWGDTRRVIAERYRSKRRKSRSRVGPLQMMETQVFIVTLALV